MSIPTKPLQSCGINNYSTKVDIWRLGCISGEMAGNRDILFNELCELGVLMVILQFLGNPSKHHLWVKELKYFSTFNSLLNFFSDEQIPTEAYCSKKEIRTNFVGEKISFTPLKSENEMMIRLKDDQTASHLLKIHFYSAFDSFVF